MKNLNLLVILCLVVSLITGCSGVGSCLKISGSGTNDGENYSGGIEYCWNQGKTAQAGAPVLESPDSKEDVILIPVSAVEKAADVLSGEADFTSGAAIKSLSLKDTRNGCIRFFEALKKKGWKPRQ